MEPTTGERLAVVEEKCIQIHEYIFNGLTHRMGRIETAVYLLVLGVAGTLLATVLQVLAR
jgi:hypothetical protein